ncbi:hypothetical protein DV515_00015038 [Chloebia gouldiae]|uniref:Uncharacterized protein n=1 Tax=Chloebia gouldiae TaxID=44316 RepID=A0A3L8RWB6_CHLGU|nr:hypothetical protein DV515_00015038 [Chloebia gouldiae]
MWRACHVLVVDVHPLMGQLLPRPVEGSETAEQENLLGGAAGNVSEAEGLQQNTWA